MANVQGVTSAGIQGLFSVCKSLYEAAPWSRLAASDIFRCTFTAPGATAPTTLYCVSMGQSGRMYGFSFYEVRPRSLRGCSPLPVCPLPPCHVLVAPLVCVVRMSR